MAGRMPDNGVPDIMPWEVPATHHPIARLMRRFPRPPTRKRRRCWFTLSCGPSSSRRSVFHMPGVDAHLARGSKHAEQNDHLLARVPHHLADDSG